MRAYNVHAGHGLSGGKGSGAAVILDESIENRKVKNELIRLLRESGDTVYDCTYEGNADQDTILVNIVKKCNQHNVDLDISIHLNSGRNDTAGDGSTGGVEVYGYDNDVKDIGERICNAISDSLDIRNRGFKINKGLYVLSKTNSKAILIECCFVDDRDDSDHWSAEKCAAAICSALGYNLNGIANNTTNITNKYNVGQFVTYSSYYSRPNAGINEAIIKGGQGKIADIVNGQAKYKLGNGCYVNDGDIRGIISTATSSVSASTKTLNVNAYYKVYANGRWYNEVKNLDDYAGDGKNAIRGIAIKVDNGSVKYRVHLKNKNWLPYVTRYNILDSINGYAGNNRDDIDCVEVYYITPDGYAYKKAKYRLAPLNKSYYNWQYDNETINEQDGYSGQFGISFGKFQLIIE